MGIDRSHRTIRYYLGMMDEEGLTQNLGKRGRSITPLGEMELRGARTVEKVGFMAAKVDELAYQMSLDIDRMQGRLILNISLIDDADVRRAVDEMLRVYSANLGMGRYVALAGPGEQLGDFVVPEGSCAVGTVCSITVNGVLLKKGIVTVCSITVNGVLLKKGIVTQSRFGGLLEMRDGQPHRFTEIINYDGTTIDPLEIFISGQMTQVGQVAATGNGVVGASFREIPTVGINEVERINGKLEETGLGAVLVIGKPNQPLLDVPVAQGRTGIIVMAGLNPLAAVEEVGIKTANWAMKTMFGFEQLVPYEKLRTLARSS
jgi:repressor of nif and glnA expression